MNLDEIRGRIDKLDLELLSLLEQRMDLSLRSRKHKDITTDLGREETVLDRARRTPLGLLGRGAAERIFRILIQESKSLQEEVGQLVAFQGEHGAWGEVATRALAPAAGSIPCLEFEDVFEGVESGAFDLGVVPVENSIEGMVTQVNTLLTRTDLKVSGEIKIPVQHCLLAPEGSRIENLRVIYSHPQALGQCRGFIEGKGFEARPFYDTAGAARMLSRERPRAAGAIASRLSGEIYGLEVLAEDISDHEENSTRFLLLSREAAESGDKCSIIFSVRHESGSLFDALRLFSESHINLTRIASMPLRSEPGNFSFFLDFEGSDRDPKVKSVLEQLQKSAIAFKMLGCYPKN
jgi:prephenate dehydratase/chorismate mutase